MAKAQSFADKVKSAQSKDVPAKMVKLVFSYKSEKTGAWKFGDKLIRVPLDADEDQFIEQELQNLKAASK